MLVLKMVNRHLAKLTREYTATQKGNLRALAIAEELSQVGDGGFFNAAKMSTTWPLRRGVADSLNTFLAARPRLTP